MKRTGWSNYQFTVDPQNPEDLQRLADLRAQIKDENLMKKTLGFKNFKRVAVNGRWGKNNPNSPAAIHGKGNYGWNAYQRCPLKIAKTWDVYIGDRT